MLASLRISSQPLQQSRQVELRIGKPKLNGRAKRTLRIAALPEVPKNNAEVVPRFRVRWVQFNGLAIPLARFLFVASGIEGVGQIETGVRIRTTPEQCVAIGVDCFIVGAVFFVLAAELEPFIWRGRPCFE
jgi:hypothetical protein